MADADNTQTAPEKTSRHYRRPPSPRVVVTIDEQIIDNAIRRDSRHCMVAEAIQALLPNMASVTVDLATIRFSDLKKRLRYMYYTPPRVAWAIVHFDQGIKPEPFTFTLRSASHITRIPSGGRGKHRTVAVNSEDGTTSQSPAARRNERRRDRKKSLAQISAPNVDEPFEPPKEYRARVITALNDPEAPLGPPLAFTPVGGNNTNRPTVVGGNPAPKGNLAKTRRFGLREMRE